MKRKHRSKAKIRLSGDPALSTFCEPVVEGEDTSQIIRDMSHILSQSKNGIGLSANQAGHLKRIIIIRYPNFQILTNPIISNVSEDTKTEQEGCLSYPGIFKRIKRHKTIEVECNEWVGKRIYHDLPARIVQHEIDHLNGICAVSKVKKFKISEGR